MKKAIITLAFSICLASLAWAGEGSVTWDLSQLDGTFSNATTIKATDSDAELTIVSGTFCEQEYAITGGSYTTLSRKGISVELAGFEPASKQGDHTLSTCLFRLRFSCCIKTRTTKCSLIL